MTWIKEKQDKGINEKIVLVLRWLEDIKSGDMIRSLQYTREYLEFNFEDDNIAIYELNIICMTINTFLKYENYFITFHDDRIYPPIKIGK